MVILGIYIPIYTRTVARLKRKTINMEKGNKSSYVSTHCRLKYSVLYMGNEMTKKLKCMAIHNRSTHSTLYVWE